MADLTDAISKVGVKSFGNMRGNFSATSKVGVKSFGDFWGEAKTSYSDPTNPGLTIFNRWYSKDNNDGMGVKSFGSFQSNFDTGDGSVTGDGGVGVKSFGTFPVSQIFPSGESSVGVHTFGVFSAPGPQGAWVKWARVGTTDFTIDKADRGGKMPMDWPGLVSNLRKLGNSIIAYGTNGVTVLSPAGKMFGMNTIHRIGLIGRDAFAGTDFTHFFIDNIGRLYQLTSEGPKLLDYREYLASLTNPVLTLDEANNLLYICDGTTGYIYSPDSQSLGKGPVNVTSMSYQSEVQYVTASSAIVTPTFEIWTDTYDLGTRTGKNVQSLEIGTALTENLYASIRYRENKSGAFNQTNWYSVDNRGQSFIPCYGSEFQFGFKSDVYEYFEIDYVTINGEPNAH